MVSVRGTHPEGAAEIAEDGCVGNETERCAEMRRMLKEYGSSGLTGQEFCEQRGLARLHRTNFERRRACASEYNTLVSIRAAEACNGGAQCPI